MFLFIRRIVRGDAESASKRAGASKCTPTAVPPSAKEPTCTSPGTGTASPCGTRGSTRGYTTTDDFAACAMCHHFVNICRCCNILFLYIYCTYWILIWSILDLVNSEFRQFWIWTILDLFLEYSPASVCQLAFDHYFHLLAQFGWLSSPEPVCLHWIGDYVSPDFSIGNFILGFFVAGSTQSGNKSCSCNICVVPLPLYSNLSFKTTPIFYLFQAVA